MLLKHCILMYFTTLPRERSGVVMTLTTGNPCFATKRAWTKTLRRDAERSKEVRIDDEVIAQIQSIIDQATYAWSDLQSIQDTLQSMASNARRSLQIAVGNSALAAQQLLLAQSEIIGSLGIPLIEKPSMEDQRLEIKLDILQRWTRSAIQLRGFLGALEMLKGNSDDINDDAMLERLLDSLRAALADFEDAQSKLIGIEGPTERKPGQVDGIDETDDQDR